MVEITDDFKVYHCVAWLLHSYVNVRQIPPLPHSTLQTILTLISKVRNHWVPHLPLSWRMAVMNLDIYQGQCFTFDICNKGAQLLE